MNKFFKFRIFVRDINKKVIRLKEMLGVWVIFGRDFLFLFIKFKCSLIFGVIKNGLCVMRLIIVNIVDCYFVELWKVICFLCKGYICGLGFEIKKRKGLNKDVDLDSVELVSVVFDIMVF